MVARQNLQARFEDIGATVIERDHSFRRLRFVNQRPLVKLTRAVAGQTQGCQLGLEAVWTDVEKWVAGAERRCSQFVVGEDGHAALQEVALGRSKKILGENQPNIST